MSLICSGFIGKNSDIPWVWFTWTSVMPGSLASGQIITEATFFIIGLYRSKSLYFFQKGWHTESQMLYSIGSSWIEIKCVNRFLWNLNLLSQMILLNGFFPSSIETKCACKCLYLISHIHISPLTINFEQGFVNTR